MAPKRPTAYHFGVSPDDYRGWTFRALLDEVDRLNGIIADSSRTAEWAEVQHELTVIEYVMTADLPHFDDGWRPDD